MNFSQVIESMRWMRDEVLRFSELVPVPDAELVRCQFLRSKLDEEWVPAWIRVFCGLSVVEVCSREDHLYIGGRSLLALSGAVACYYQRYYFVQLIDYMIDGVDFYLDGDSPLFIEEDLYLLEYFSEEVWKTHGCDFAANQLEVRYYRAVGMICPLYIPEPRGSYAKERTPDGDRRLLAVFSSVLSGIKQ